jgi:CheY-like chemotaxis protein
LAEDDDEMRSIVALHLRGIGYTVHEFADGASLLTAIQASRQDPAVVVTDHHMPGLLGLEAMEVLRSCRPQVPFVLMTAFGDRQTHDWAERIGAHTVLDKPFDLQWLCTLIEALARVEAPQESRQG